MKTPEAPNTDKMNARHKFYGEMVGAHACNEERINRLQDLVDYVREEQIGLINAVGDDLNAATETIRDDLNDSHGMLHNNLSGIKDDFYKRHTKLGDRIDRRVTLTTHNLLAERVFTAIDTKKGEVEKVIESLTDRVVEVERFAAANKTSWGTAKWFAGSISGVAGFVMWTFITGVTGDIEIIENAQFKTDKVLNTLGESFRDYRKDAERVHREIREGFSKQPSTGGLR